MGLGPMEISGALSRLQDYATMKQQEDNRLNVNQTNVSLQLNKAADDRANTVERSNATGNDQKKFDAKEKGSNEYHGDGGKSKNKAPDKKSDGIVRPKALNSSFDIRI